MKDEPARPALRELIRLLAEIVAEELAAERDQAPHDQKSDRSVEDKPKS